MEIKVTIDKPKPNFLTKLSAVFFGMFLTSLVFAMFTRFLGVAGIWVSLVVCILLILVGFYYIKKGTTLRIITWSILVTIILGTTAFYIGLQFLEQNLDTLIN